jgi:hypothetical protein
MTNNTVENLFNSIREAMDYKKIEHEELRGIDIFYESFAKFKKRPDKYINGVILIGYTMKKNTSWHKNDWIYTTTHNVEKSLICRMYLGSSEQVCEKRQSMLLSKLSDANVQLKLYECLINIASNLQNIHYSHRDGHGTWADNLCLLTTYRNSEGIPPIHIKDMSFNKFCNEIAKIINHTSGYMRYFDIRIDADNNKYIFESLDNQNDAICDFVRYTLPFKQLLEGNLHSAESAITSSKREEPGSETIMTDEELIEFVEKAVSPYTNRPSDEKEPLELFEIIENNAIQQRISLPTDWRNKIFKIDFQRRVIPD